jgi:hypothetical protein
MYPCVRAAILVWGQCLRGRKWDLHGLRGPLDRRVDTHDDCGNENIA